MQPKMEKHPLTERQIHSLLTTEHVGRLASIGNEGTPYITPVNFIFMDGKIYIHGRPAGEKFENILRSPRVCFEVDTMHAVIHGETPCAASADYESVIIRGVALLIDSTEKKRAALDAFITKYTPEHSGKPFPDAVLAKTSLIEISLTSCTGKYYTKE